jgi:hypothetical protein
MCTKCCTKIWAELAKADAVRYIPESGLQHPRCRLHMLVNSAGRSVASIGESGLYFASSGLVGHAVPIL